MSATRIRLLGMLAAVAGCTSTERAPVSATSNAPVPGSGGGGTADSAPAPETLEVEPETVIVKTNTGSEPQFVFRIALKYGPSEPYHTLLGERAKFVGSDGTTTPASITALEVKYGEPGLGDRIGIVPASKLAPGQWYSLEIQEDSKLAVRSLGSSGADSNPWRLAFFTSSAPHLTRSQWSPKDVTILRLEFSEMLDLGTVAVHKLVSQGGVPISKCVLIGGTCTLTTPTLVAGVVHVQLTTVPDTNQPVTVLLGNGVMGEGQTVAEGSKTATYYSELTTEGLVTSVDWKDCQPGNAKCWTWHGGPLK